MVGAPRLPSSVMGRWLWGPLPSAQEEALWLGEQLGCHPLTGANATKERVLAALGQAECVHFATHISWKLAALILAPSQEHGAATGGGVERAAGRPREKSAREASSPGEVPLQDGEGSLRSRSSPDDGESVCEADGMHDSPPLNDLLLTAADILDLCLAVKLVVLR